jgi:peptidoglycan/xylan/chitin deacetylase (PgdA/CDA1 family)
MSGLFLKRHLLKKMIARNVMRLLWVVVFLLFAVVVFLLGGWVVGVLLHVAVVAPLLWGTLSPNSRLFGPIWSRADDEGIWLTLDDGPDPEDTPKILELLERHGIHAVFFVVGQKAEKYPELIRRIHDSGHVLGNHTWSHPQASFWCKGPWATQREIVRCQEVVESITGEAPTMFRAPVGHSNFFVHPVLRHLGLTLVGWSSRGFDAVEDDVESVTRKLFKTMAPDAIILLHESTPMAVDVVGRVIEHAHNRGWEFADPKL